MGLCFGSVRGLHKRELYRHDFAAVREQHDCSDPAMILVLIEGSGGSVMIAVLGYENPTASNESDANWLRSKVTVTVGPFTGEIEAALTTQDFAYFGRELTEVLRTLRGTAKFQTDEDSLRLEVRMGSRGAAVISGVANLRAGSKASLRFSFETDQTYLAQARHALAQVLDIFPVKQGSG